MNNIIFSVLAFFLAIGILVAIHEYGHFIVARLCGVKVVRFSIGFGPTILRWQGKRETEYVIAALPLGGYVKMIDDRKEPPLTAEELPYTFASKSVWQRMAIIAAGPIANLVFAVFAYWLMFMIGVQGTVPMIGSVIPNSVAAHIGLQPDEEIIQVDGKNTETWQDVIVEIVAHLGETDELSLQTKLKTNDLRKNYQIDLSKWKSSEKIEDILESLGVKPKEPLFPVVIGEVISGEPSDLAGFKSEDEFLAIDQHEVSSWQEMVNIVTLSANKSLKFTIKRNNEIKYIQATPRMFEKDDGEKIGYLGVSLKIPAVPNDFIRLQRFSPWPAFKQAFNKTVHYSIVTLDILRKMILGQVSLSNVSGPITMAKGAGQTASIGVQYYLGFLGLISVSLGVINFLPIPVLDGGHFLFCLIEVITRRQVAERFKIIAYQVGFTLIIILMSLAFYNDFVRFS